MSMETKRFGRMMGMCALTLGLAAVGATLVYGILTGWR